MKKIISLIISLMTLASYAQSQKNPELYIYEYKEVVDSVKADSIYAAYTATLKDRLAQAWAEPAKKIIAEIDQLMAYETSGEKIEVSSPLFRRLLICANNNKEVTEKELKGVAKGRMPRGFTEKVLKPVRKELQEKIDNYNPHIPLWDNVFKFHIDRYEIEYTSAEYEAFEIGNLDGPRTRYVNMEKVNLPYKKISVPKPNPECRDNYFNGSLHSYSDIEHPWRDYESHNWDEAQQSQGWEWLETGVMQSKTIYFPEELSYKFHPSHAEYRIKCNWRDNYCYHPNVYDEKGMLVRAGNIVGLGQEYEKMRDEVMLAICKRDFLTNKYDINHSKLETLTSLRITFGMIDAVDARFKKYMKMAQEARDEIVAATTAAQYAAAKRKQREAMNVLMEYIAKEREPQALNYLKQLKDDHATELSYLYKIERVSNTIFKVYYLNDKMECGCIALMKWRNKEPYEAEYEIELQSNETIVIRELQKEF